MVFYGFRDQDHVISIGTNGKMSEIHAAMGLTSLEYIDTIIKANFRNYDEYKRQLADVPGLRFFTVDEEEKSNRQYIVVEIDDEITGISRDNVLKVLHAENVLARRHFCAGCHNMEPYRSLYFNQASRLPATERLIRRLMTLPSGTAITVDDVVRICGLIRRIIELGGEVSERLYSLP
jgi:dTDP-4-amino-4,6-dideoxygalactose transaminase